MHTAFVYTTIGVFMVVLSKQAYSHNEHGCLTWDIRSNRLILTCRLTHFTIPVSIIDNHEQEYIKCTLKGKINNCISRHTSKSILINNSINTITLTIRKINESNVDGKWRCKQGKYDYETAVSTAKGVISATDIHLNGEVMNTGTTKKVKLKCHSCREPRKNYIEILINGSTVDGISYNKTIDKCSHRDGECKSHVCACHHAGNEFIRIFNVTSVYGSQYSCEMRFNDKDKESIFSLERSLYINDTVFYNTTEIRLIKAPPRGNDKKTRTKDTDKINEEEIGLVEKRTEISVLNSFLIVLTVLAILIILVVLYTMIKKDFGISKNNTEQTDPLVGENNESSTNSGTDGEMNEKTVDNKESDGKPSDKETETGISEPNTGGKHVCSQTTYIDNKSSDSDSSSFKEANEGTTSKYGSYAKIEQSNSVEQPEESHENTHQTDDMEPDLAEGETTPRGYHSKVVQHNVDEHQEEVPGSENISESSFQNNVMELNSTEGKTTPIGYCAKVVQNNDDEQQEEVLGSEIFSESSFQNDFMELNSIEGTEEILKLMSNVCHQCVKTSIDEPVCYWCRNCEETVCECCKETHFQGHQFEKNGSPLILMKMSIFCGNHHDTELKYFCKDHCSVFCGDCRLVDHRGCRNVLSIVDASKGFKLQEVFNDYKNFLKTILKSFGNLIKILKRWKHDVKIQAYNHQTETESNFLRVVEIGQQKIVKEQYLKEVKDDMDTCLLELQKQISIVAKCKTDIITIETSFKRIWEQLPEDKLFLMVCLSITFLQSTWKKAISDSEGINLDFPGMEVGGKNETFGTREQKLQQMLLVSLVKQELADFGTQNKIISFPQFD